MSKTAQDEAIRELAVAGKSMATLLYAASGDPARPEEWRGLAARLVRKWDATERRYNK